MHWYSGGTSKPVNWESVLEALNASELTEVAKNIQTELGKYIDHPQLLTNVFVNAWMHASVCVSMQTEEWCDNMYLLAVVTKCKHYIVM